MHVHYRTDSLNLDAKRDLLCRAHAKAFRWWVDSLDCQVSFARQLVEMPFDEILAKLDDRCHFVVIHRTGILRGEQDYLEIGFATAGAPCWFLWLHVELAHAAEFTKGLKVLL